MTTTPFLVLNLRNKKDAVFARQRARRVASVLAFDAQEQACIAAGTFIIACQALMIFGKAKISFQIENHHLGISAQEGRTETHPEAHPISRRLAGIFPEVDAKALFRLAKPLPASDCGVNQQELGWLVNKVEETACNGLFDEIVKQNQEVLALLHELRLNQGPTLVREEKTPTSHAA